MNYYAKRGNKILKINEDAVARYLAQGYNITDMSGNVVKKGTPHDANLLTAEYKKQEAEIAELKSENAKLKAELKAVREELKNAKATPVIAEPEQTEVKPTRKRRQTTTSEE